MITAARYSKVVSPFISNMPEYQVVCSCNGLICISNALFFDPIYVCNIFTGHYIELPKTSDHLEKEITLGFGNHPASKEHKIVRVVNYSNHQRTFLLKGSFLLRGFYEHSDVQIFTVGTDEWRSLGYIHWRLDPSPSVATSNGALHWITKPYWSPPGGLEVCIVAFDLAEEKFKEIERPMCGSLNGSDFHLVNLRGCLSAVVDEDEGIEIWVMQVYDVKESWTKDYVITANVPACFIRGGRPKSRTRIWRNWTLINGDTEVEVICMLKNGDILLNYDEGALVLYGPDSESFKELVFSGLPRWFSVITHVETLSSVEEALRM